MSSSYSSLIQPPTSFRLNQLAQSTFEPPFQQFQQQEQPVMASTHDSHPDIGHLVLLVFEAVLEVVCTSLPGYILARSGHFDADKQKWIASLNIQLFTPCLIFTKLASQLNARRFADLAVIPVIFVVMTLVSWSCSFVINKACRFNRRAANFVTAMSVFGNSNSLPISLVISLSRTIKGLHWDRIPGDNDNEVAARGILYLLIFQQLGQLVRWTWGFNYLLAPKDKYEEYDEERVEEGQSESPLLGGRNSHDSHHSNDSHSDTDDLMEYEPAGRTPVVSISRASPADSEDEDENAPKKGKNKTIGTDHLHFDSTHPLLTASADEISSFPRIRNSDDSEAHDSEFAEGGNKTWKSKVAQTFKRQYKKLPQGLRNVLNKVAFKVNAFLWEFMNPPLWAMLIAIAIASVPALQALFFEDGSFVKNSFSDAVEATGGVAVPLILVVLGANLARNTQATESIDPEETRIGKKLLIASLVGRMLLPTIIMTPLLALFAKYAAISILDDPIFIIVCFLLTGAPSALQLAQICQLNNVYEGVMSKILFQSYVIWILPSTLVLVTCALEVVEWAA
jgi:predicted permease